MHLDRHVRSGHVMVERMDYEEYDKSDPPGRLHTVSRQLSDKQRERVSYLVVVVEHGDDGDAFHLLARDVFVNGGHFDTPFAQFSSGTHKGVRTDRDDNLVVNIGLYHTP